LKGINNLEGKGTESGDNTSGKGKKRDPKKRPKKLPSPSICRRTTRVKTLNKYRLVLRGKKEASEQGGRPIREGERERRKEGARKSSSGERKYRQRDRHDVEERVDCNGNLLQGELVRKSSR